MELKLYKSLWGMTGSVEQMFEKIAAGGYTGVESPLFMISNPARFQQLLAEYKFDFIAQIFSSEPHSDSFREEVGRAAQYGPILINAQSAKDSMPWEQQRRFFENALAVEQEAGIAIAHETHRGRAMFTPWHTAKLLEAYPELRITADISHWLCVCESWLEDQQEALRLAAERTIHLHGRVGYPQGPQVPHPGAPEYAKELQIHRSFWEQVHRCHRLRGSKSLTCTPEFGPPGYMHTLPFSGQPVTDLWEVCQWMADWFRETFEA